MYDHRYLWTQWVCETSASASWPVGLVGCQLACRPHRVPAGRYVPPSTRPGNMLPWQRNTEICAPCGHLMVAPPCVELVDERDGVVTCSHRRGGGVPHHLVLDGSTLSCCIGGSHSITVTITTLK